MLHCLQNLLTNTSLAELSFSYSLLSYLYQVFICGTYILPQLRYFWDGLQEELASKSPYKTSIGGMRLRLQKLQEENKQAWKFRAEQLGKDNWQDIDNVLHYQGLFYVPKIIRTELINKHHNDSLVGYFRIKKTSELVAQKYYWPTLHHDVKDYMKECNVYLILKAVWYKLYMTYNPCRFLPTAGKIYW